MKNCSVIAIIMASIVVGCSKEEVTPRNYPRVNTIEVTDITSGGATFKAEITFSSVPVLDHGFLWSEFALPLVSNSDKISLGSKSVIGTFEAKCDRSLQEGKKFYVRAYATSENHDVFGKVVEFVSLGSKAPVLKDFYPALGTWEDTVTLVGENFSDVRSKNVVKFNQVSAAIIKASSDTLQVIVPLSMTEDFSSISVSLSGNTSTLAKKFQLKAPIIESISPDAGAPGTIVTITGKFFNGTATKCYFNNLEAALVSGTTNLVKFKAPTALGLGQAEVKVVTGSGGMTDIANFEVKSPELLQIVPATAGEGDEIKLIGNFFSSDIATNKVTFENSIATVTSATPTELRVIVPPDVDKINPTVTVTIGAMQTSSVSFSFLAPVVESFTPISGYGSIITITGKNFKKGGYNKVFIGDLELSSPYASSPTKIDVYVDKLSNTHTGKIKVTFHEQEGLSAQDFKMTWANLNDYPDTYNDPTATLVYNNNAYTGFGGSTFNNFWRFNTTTRVWTRMADFLGQRRQAFATFTAGSKGYMGGGYFNNYVTAKDLWEYNFANNSWTQKADLPITGVIRGYFSYNGTGYILSFDPATSESTSTLWKYNQASDSWSIASSAPFPLFSESNNYIADNALYVYTESTLWKYNLANGQWTSIGWVDNVPGKSFTIGGIAYGSGIYNGLYKFDSATNTWTFETSPLVYYVTPSQMFAVNGRGFAIIQNTVLEFEP